MAIRPSSTLFSPRIAILSSSQEAGGTTPSYARFTFDATLYPPEDDYDYIIVVGGTTGCPLAATLSAAGHHVLLLERGGTPDEFPSLSSQDGFLQTLVAADSLDSPAQSFVSDDGVPKARDRVLDGSSAINAGFYSRAHREFFNAYGAEWDPEMVEKAVGFRPELKSWVSAVRDGLIKANVLSIQAGGGIVLLICWHWRTRRI